ncbi:MAG: cyclopropane-fatty-acyl-phospholipid synthase family protein [Rhodospirillales bacterium]|nr:cyclopropane-fatty-acyl-phospholipid synthase family protein [Rhodospirillales bacterium]
MQADIEYPERFQRGSLAESLVLALAARINAGELAITLPHGGERHFEGAQAGPRAAVRVYHPRVFRRVLLGGTLAFAEAYMEGDCDSPDLAALVELVIQNEAALLTALDGQRWTRALQRLGHRLRPNSKRGSRRNIARHYDLGNDFYALWLDRSMTYSSAVFEGPGEPLEAAQDNKYRRMAALAAIGPDDRVLEVGCGWGGFCSWAAREIGCRVTAITISRAQYDFAARRLQAEGLAERVDLRLQDYRDIDGSFDRIVSIEMLEAVGERYWPRYFAMLRDRLVPGGRAALQVITIADDLFEVYRKDVDFIQRYIFPGGLLPSPGRLGEEARGAGLDWHGGESIRLHYARTLAVWRRSFEAAWPEVLALGFDERFRRMWRYYLAYCEAGFETGRIDVLQAALSKS